ncbi:DUF421 domain-containing protein [Gymnodinialimonas ceratoperidinii]|uniref:DUF421 domain-containing protein n=1 Tax=Gymnodinialimonas ceratoperidinii TaxID=2856823 RepID=A0A8F6YD06_9RHOB|nr:YetF domain-containing protein [Gymnodinialimonas ceratoperidinii]QXT39895.1 DUF421 domain-containing protein [Gymnodinialimonas ceratoperidinii]
MFFDAITAEVLTRGIVLSFIGLIWVIMVVRVIGLRTFSKMTAFDFVATVATGSLLAGATQATDWAGFFQPVLAIAALLGAQFIFAHIRRSSDTVAEILQNNPVLLMEDGVINEDALGVTRVARSDLIAKLREANVLHFSEVRAVVLETTGDISVLHGDKLEASLLEGVQRIDD